MTFLLCADLSTIKRTISCITQNLFTNKNFNSAVNKIPVNSTDDNGSNLLLPS